MKSLLLTIIALFLINFVSAYATYDPPTSQEQNLFSQLLSQFEKTDVSKKDVTDVIQTFEKPLIISFPCNSNDTNNFVVSVITTKLAKFDETTVHEDQVIGGTYTWNCLVTTEVSKVTLQCNNELRLNPTILLNATGVSPTVHQVENQVVLYHEFLHGQLMIDAIKFPSPWRHEVCNKAPQETIDYSYADPDHKIINPLQTKFASELMEEQGGAVITKNITLNETQNGSFAIKVFNINDYPQFVNGGEATLRAVNINSTKFGSFNNTVFLEGYLINKTQPGIAWLYIFANQTSKEPKYSSNPLWEKRVAGLWANAKASDSDFYNMIQNFTGQKIIPTNDEKFAVGTVPNWLKNTANWWFEGKIDDATFLNSIQYLISSKIIS
ncbi:MAG: hypothetical protein KGI08_01360 [Thaumarchaeota archaeon]|nr:hypothetical protein [Nitrososphaerota archaeon]